MNQPKKCVKCMRVLQANPDIPLRNLFPRGCVEDVVVMLNGTGYCKDHIPTSTEMVDQPRGYNEEKGGLQSVDQPTESKKEKQRAISFKPWARLLGRWMSENIETYDPESEKALLLALDENISSLIETTRKEAVEETVQYLSRANKTATKL